MKHKMKYFVILFVSLCLCLGTLFGAVHISSALADSSEYTVHFFSDGSEISESQMTTENGTLKTLPSEPSAPDGADSAKFVGWFNDPCGVEEISTSTTFSKDTNVYAKWAYEIGVTQSEAFTLTLNDSHIAKDSVQAENFESAVSELLNACTKALPVILNFESVTLNESFELSLNEIKFSESAASCVELSGTLTLSSNESSVILNKFSENQTLNLNKLTVKGNSESTANLIELESGEVAAETANNVFVKSCTFEGGVHSIHSNGIGTIINFYEDITCSSKFFANYNYVALKFSGNENNFSNQIKISVPYDTNATVVDGAKLANQAEGGGYESGIVIESESEDLYFVDCHNNFSSNSTFSIYAAAKIRVNFDLNGGSYVDDFSAIDGIVCNESNEQNFPNRINVVDKYQANTFLGWIGVIKFSKEEIESLGETYFSSFARGEDESVTLYFDAASLSACNDDYSAESITANFGGNLKELQKSIISGNYFSGYVKGNDQSKFLDLFLNYKKVPSFTAAFAYGKFNLNVYADSPDGEPQTYVIEQGEVILSYIESPTKVGHNFLGWYFDPTFGEGQKMDDGFEMPDHDISIYANWQVKSFTVIFNLYKESGDAYKTESQTYDFGEKLDLEEPIRYGYEFAGWFKDEDFQNQFTDTVMPDNDGETLNLYANWTPNVYLIYFSLNLSEENFNTIQVNFGENFPTLDKIFESEEGKRLRGDIGYNFLGIFKSDENLDSNRLGDEIFGNPMDSDLGLAWREISDEYQKYYVTTLHIIFEPKSFTLNLYITKNQTPDEEIVIAYNQPIQINVDTKIEGMRIEGWYEDSNFEKVFSLETMPARDLNIYAKWIEKLSVSIPSDSQSCYSSQVSPFAVESTLGDFVVEYYVDGNWTTSIPTKIGTYDVRVSRDEDEQYKSFEMEIKGGLIIQADNLNLTWLIALLFSLFILEVFAIIIVRIMRKMKKNSVIPALVPIFSYTITSSQFVLLIISSILAVFGLVLLIYEIIKLAGTVPSYENELPDKVTKNQSISGIDFEDESEPEELKYSASDIEKMLSHDEYGEQHRSKLSRPAKKASDKNYESTLEKISKYKQKIADEKIENSANNAAPAPESKIAGAKSERLKNKKDVNFVDSEELYDNDDEMTKKSKIK